MKNIVACVFIGVFLSGCGLFFRESYNKINYYDLSYPEVKQSIGDLGLSIVKPDKPYSDKMVFRVSENRIEMDEFNRWSCNPSDLISKYFTLAFDFENSSKDKSKRCLLSMEILRIEANLKTSSVELILKVSIQNSKNGDVVLKKTYSQTIPVEKVTGESFAKGVETAMGKICVELSQDIQKIKQ